MKENSVITKTFFWMFLGLIGTAIVAWYTYSTDLLIDIIDEGAWGIILIVELIVVLLFSFLFRRLSPTVVRNTIFCLFSDKWIIIISNFFSI